MPGDISPFQPTPSLCGAKCGTGKTLSFTEVYLCISYTFKSRYQNVI